MAASPLPIARELAGLARQVEALRRRVEALEQLRPVTDAELLEQLAASIGSRVFTVKDLRAHARVDAPLAALLERLDSSTALGKRFRRLADRPRGPFVLERLGVEHSAVLWRIRRGV